MKKVQLTTLVMFLITAFVMSGCGGTDFGAYVINTSGGVGGASGGYGGYGGIRSIEEFQNLGHIEQSAVGLIAIYLHPSGNPVTVKSTGTADASFSAINPGGNLGANPLYITKDTFISLPDSPPETGVAYFGDSDRIYISDGDEGTDDQAVTGIQVYGGRTLTLFNNFDDVAVVYLENDFLNNGTVTTLQDEGTSESRIGIRMRCGSFINRGKVSLEGTVPGQHGGRFVVECYYNLHNMGPIDTFGADNADGTAGDGAEILFYGYHLAQNIATLNSYGGNATGTAGSGGSQGFVVIDAETIHNSGAINAYSGDGVDSFESDFNRGVTLGNYYFEFPDAEKLKEVSLTGPILNSGTIKTYGGTASSGDGDNGGYIFIGAEGGREVRNSGSLYTNGGSTKSLDFNGGHGAPICIGSAHSELLVSYFVVDKDIETKPKALDAPKGSSEGISFDIQVSGNLVVNGGRVPSDPSATGNGGNGGFITVVHGGYSNDGTLELLGYGAINTSGGDGNVGGPGGSVYFGLYRYDDLTGVVNNVPIIAKGGNGLVNPVTNVAMGGSGGDVEFMAARYHLSEQRSKVDSTKTEKAYVEFNKNIVNTAPIVTSGGTNYNAESFYGPQSNGPDGLYAAAGHVLMVTPDNIDNSGQISANGGSDQGDIVAQGTGFGGNAGLVMMGAGNGITNTGSINVSGGKASFSGGACHYSERIGGVEIMARDFIDCPASITTNGGDANPALENSRGGNGGMVLLECTSGPAAVTHGPISARAGTGWVDGETNDIIVGGILIQDGTANYDG